MTPTTEQIREILDGALEGATYVDWEGEYAFVDQATKHIQWCSHDSFSEFMDYGLIQLDLLREILTLRQRVEELEQKNQALINDLNEAWFKIEEKEDRINALAAHVELLTSKLNPLVDAAVLVADSRCGDVDTENGSYATTSIEEMLCLESEIGEAFGVDDAVVVWSKVKPEIYKLFNQSPATSLYSAQVRPIANFDLSG